MKTFAKWTASGMAPYVLRASIHMAAISRYALYVETRHGSEFRLRGIFDTPQKAKKQYTSLFGSKQHRVKWTREEIKPDETDTPQGT